MKPKFQGFQVGTRFVGNVNGAQMEIVKIVKRKRKNSVDLVVYRDLQTGKTHTYGLKALERCDITIL